MLRVVDVMSAELPGFRHFAVAGGEGVNLAAPFIRALMTGNSLGLTSFTFPAKDKGHFG